MKAIVYTQYGSPDVLHIKEVAKPNPKDNEILIKVQAASVNRSDWECLIGKPLYARLDGLLKPGHPILGSDVAGRVEAIGKNVKQFHMGDEVFGLTWGYKGGFAEYACLPESTTALKPTGITFEVASTIPQAAVIALQGIRDKGQVQAGQTVLINGAGGAAGMFAVQLAKLYGAEVTGVDHSGKLDFMRSLGADHVIDFTQEDFTRNGKQYDVILDVIAQRPVFDYQRALTNHGQYFCVGGSVMTFLQILLFGSRIKRTTGKQVGILAVHPNPKDMVYITELCQAGKLVPIIDKRYPLSETAAAIRYLGEGHAKGKIIITLDQNT
ncbi:MAG: NAD(P)-dependent alcohol dehydrogenase [Anaerolineae bacterium]